MNFSSLNTMCIVSHTAAEPIHRSQNKFITWLLFASSLMFIVFLTSARQGSKTSPVELSQPEQSQYLTSEQEIDLQMPAPILSPGQNLRFDRISLEEGLSQSTVFCMLQDSQGFMWFGTE